MSKSMTYKRNTDAAARAYHDAVLRTGRVSIYELMDRTGVAFKTIVRHVKAGRLRGKKITINGKPTWTFTEGEADRYQRRADMLVEEGRRTGGAYAPETPDGYLTLEDLAERRGCSHWFLRDAIKAGTLAALPGKHGKLFVPAPAARTFQGPMVRGRPRISTVTALVWFAKDLMTMSDQAIATICEVRPETVATWPDAHPNARSIGLLLAHIRETARPVISAPLKEIAENHRRAYMRAYMAGRRADKPPAKRSEEQNKLHRAHERERYARKREAILKTRRIKRTLRDLPDG